MADQEKVVWSIHAGTTGQADSIFLEKNQVAVGWPRIADLREIPPDRDSFKQRMKEAYPEAKQGAIPTTAGVLFRFLHEVKPGDLVVYRSKVDKKVHIGEITGDYDYVSGARYPHRRPVRWLRQLPPTALSQGALYEIGSTLTLSQVRKYAPEMRALAEGKPPGNGEDTNGPLPGDIEEITRAFVLKRLAQELKGHPLEEFVAHLLETIGYRCRIAPEGPDGGIDIVAHKDELGVEPPFIRVQVKSTEGTVGRAEVSDLAGQIARAGVFGLFVTLGSFSKDAVRFAQGVTDLRLIDGDGLVDLVLEHYEELDSRYKGIIPLKKVYIPQPLEETEEP